MDGRYTGKLLLAAAAAFWVLSAAFAQTPAPTLPEDADDEQTMVPENAEDDEDLTAEDADDDTAQARTDDERAADAPRADSSRTESPGVTPTPTAEPIRRAQAPARVGGQAPMNILILADNTATDGADPLASGCWVRMYEAENFSGSTVTLVGPAELSEMRGPFGMQWEDRVGSFEVGPSATVSVFSDDGFDGTETRYSSRRRVADAADEFESLRIACARTATG
jgi:hypothetical protein